MNCNTTHYRANSSSVPGDPTAESPALGTFTASGTYFSLAGDWTVNVQVQRAGHDDIALRYTVNVAPAVVAPERTAFGSPAPQLSANRFAAFVLLTIGLGGAILWPRAKRLRPAVFGMMTAGTTIALLAGVTLAFSDPTGHLHSNNQVAARPNPGDPASIQRGAMLFQSNCVVCHGPNGRGDGPAARNLNPPPLDLVIHVPLHPDTDLFRFISEGVPGTAMPAWKTRLTEKERWDLVNFLRATFDATK